MAGVKNSEGISEMFDCLMGVKQGCPLSATLFGSSVDGLEQHLMDTVAHDAPSLSGVLIPLLLCADDLIIVSTRAAGLQWLPYWSNGHGWPQRERERERERERKREREREGDYDALASQQV